MDDQSNPAMEEFKDGLMKAIRTAINYYLDDYRFFADDFFGEPEKDDSDFYIDDNSVFLDTED